MLKMVLGETRIEHNAAYKLSFRFSLEYTSSDFYVFVIISQQNRTESTWIKEKNAHVDDRFA